MVCLGRFETLVESRDDLAVLRDEHGDELLPADLADRRAVVQVDLDPLDLDALEGERERDTLDVRRERDAQHADRCRENAPDGAGSSR